MFLMDSKRKSKASPMLPFRYMEGVHEFVDFKQTGENEVKVLVMFEFEKLFSFTYEMSEDDNELTLTKENIIMEQYHAFHFPYLACSFGRNYLIIYSADDVEKQYMIKVDKEFGYITYVYIT